MKVLVVGDTHAMRDSARVLAKIAEEQEVKEIWQCGDLGWWPRDRVGKQFINLLAELPVPLYFADGNHEDHDRLTHDAPDEHEIAPNIWYVPRGVVRNVYGRQVLFYGGARSVDRQWRTPGVSWFVTELPSRRQQDRAMAVGQVDIVVAHESPHWVQYGYPPNHLSRWPLIDLEVAHGHRQTLSELAERVSPRLWFNGHHHKRVTQSNDDGVTVHTLNESTSEPSKWMVTLDLETMEVSRV